jgi:hypothetical protein
VSLLFLLLKDSGKIFYPGLSQHVDRSRAMVQRKWQRRRAIKAASNKLSTGMQLPTSMVTGMFFDGIMLIHAIILNLSADGFVAMRHHLGVAVRRRRISQYLPG